MDARLSSNPVQRMDSSDSAKAAVKGVIDSALTRHQVSSKLQEAYVQQLIEDGYSSVELISIMGEKDFPKMVKMPHRKLIREQAKREAEKAAQSQQQEISPRDVTADMEKQKSSGGCCAVL